MKTLIDEIEKFIWRLKLKKENLKKNLLNMSMYSDRIAGKIDMLDEIIPELEEILKKYFLKNKK